MRALAARDLQDYQSQYIDLYDKYRRKDSGVKENINDDILFELGLIKQVEVNIRLYSDVGGEVPQWKL